jgi:hypothetical protein
MLLVVVISTAASPSVTHPATAAANVAVSTAGDDSTCVRGNLTRACATFNRAYQVAQCGDVVEVAAGAYPWQTFWGPSKTCSSHVVFQPAAGAVVSVDHIQNDGGAGWVEIRNFKLLGRMNLYRVHDWRVVRIDGGSFDLVGTNIVMTGNDWGPCYSSGTPSCEGQNFLSGSTGNSNIVIDGDVFHDFVITGPGDHFECLYVNGSGGPIVIRNSRFSNCQTYGIYFTSFLPGHEYNGTITLDNNWFGPTCCLGTAPRESTINLGGAAPGGPVRNLIIRHNTFTTGQTIVREGGLPGSNIRAVGNLFGKSGSCLGDVLYLLNLYPSAPCSSEDRDAPPYGYARGVDRLVPDGRSADAVRMAFRAAAAGSDPRTIARTLAKGRYPRPARLWSVRAVRDVLTNRDYLGGTIGWQRSHPPLVSKPVWKRAQRVARD